MSGTNIHALSKGYRILWYEIESILGQGGFGITYLARDTNLDTDVAIKEFLPSELAGRTSDGSVHPISNDRFSDFGWGLARFIAEAQTLAKFNHPNIVKVHSVFELNNTAYMVMAYEQGRSLEQAFRFRQVESEEALRKILFPLLDGVETLHKAGFIHRDIKPANVYLRPDETPVLLDFGSARQALGVRTKTLTALVTPGYAPFEQYDTGKDLDKQGPWTDIYALGATLYRAVAGRGPPDAMTRANALFDGADALEPAMAIGHGRYSTSFLHAIDQALAFRSQDRPQSIAQWRSLFVGAPTSSVDDTQSAVETVVYTNERTTPTPPKRIDDPAAQSFSRESGLPAKNRTIPLLLGVIFLMAGGLAWTLLAPENPDSGVATENTDGEPKEAIGLAAINRLAAEELKAKQEQERIAALKVEEQARLAELHAAEQARREAEATAHELARKHAADEAERLAKLKTEERERLAEIARLEAATRQAAEDTEREAALKAEQDAKIAELQRLEEERVQAEAARVAEATRQQQEKERLAELQAEEDAARLAVEQAAAQAQIAQAQEAALAADNQRDEQIERLLAEGRQHLTELRLTSPPGSNAFETFTKVRELDPANPRAKAGMEAIVDRYLELARQSAMKTDFDQATGYLERAESVAPGLEKIVAAREKLEARRTAVGSVQEPSQDAEASKVAEAAEIEKQTNAPEASAPVASTDSTQSVAPLKVGVLWIASNAQDANWPRDIASRVAKVVEQHAGYTLQWSYYNDTEFANDRINDADIWQDAGIRKSLNVAPIYHRASALGLDVIVAVYQRRGDFYNIQTSTLHLYVIDVAKRKVLETETKYAGLVATLDRLLDNHRSL